MILNSRYNTETIESARLLWSYLSSPKQTVASDAIVVCCSYDLRVCDFACEMILSGLSDRLVLSGKTGNWTRQLWRDAEANIFLQRAVENGVGEDSILLELKSSNFGENIRFSKKMLPELETVTFVSKPNSLLRVQLTAQAQWSEVQSYVCSPDLSFPDDVSNAVGILGVIHEMVGDIERIQRYPALGYQVYHELPKYVLDAWSYLVECGFTEHMISRQD